ncbi:ABC transporter permease [Pseudomonas aeruginosa]|uniref:ABC transporter permease n=1 Tax=Pseudomonas aeruginosa TaxID=287 RepID=UPI002B26B7CB|nr:ABC transporter permease [Pseudomonas aeruginosa]MEA8593001.1 ABC transporter permease [Pseudomonas aeruginosa]
MSVGHARGILGWSDLVRNLVAKEIKVRYMGAVLGFAWSLGNPLVVTLTYYVVFTFILPSGQDRFALHLVTGVVHWMLLQQIITQSCEWLINNHTLIQKLHFPRLLLPVSGALTVGVFWTVALAVYWALIPLLGGVVTHALIWYPIVLASFVALVVGTGLALSVLQVAHRDIKHLVDVFVPLLFWFTPIVWVTTSLPAEVRNIVAYNPVAPFFNAFSSILHQGVAPEPSQLLLCITLGMGALATGLAVFRKADNVVEYL